jgi:hypothetical protein
MKAWSFTVIVNLLALTACKKEKDLSPARVEQIPQPKYDTVRPNSDYFPAFPGSWWKYETASGNSFTDFTKPTFEKDWYHWQSFAPGGQMVIYSDTAYVPIFVSAMSIGPYATRGIWGNMERKGTQGGTRLYNIINETMEIGNEWLVEYFTHSWTYGRILVKDTSIVVKKKTFLNVIMVGYYGSNGSLKTPLYSWAYYARNIGLVKLETAKDTTWLVDYYINKL